MFVKELNHHINLSFGEEIYSYVNDGDKLGRIQLYINDNTLDIEYMEINEAYRKRGWGTKMVNDLFIQFPQITELTGFSNEEVLKFWSKQTGFHVVGEGNDEYEGYARFEINKGS